MISHSKILPLLIIVAMISFSVRLTEVITGISDLSSNAFAQSVKAEDTQEPKAKDADEHVKNDDKDETKGAEVENGVENVDGEEAVAPEWRDASDSNLDVAGIKLEMFADLSERRARLEEIEKTQQVREALLEAAEKELDRKIEELDSLRNEIKGLLEEQGGQEAERIDSLVKIYEGMKPKDAARIFDTLDLDVLGRVMSKMSERKVGPVLAAMNAERARTVTIMLAEEKNLPVIE
jgi:flagellar motility protein MotE (MotC chaperone)